MWMDRQEDKRQKKKKKSEALKERQINRQMQMQYVSLFLFPAKGLRACSYKERSRLCIGRLGHNLRTPTPSRSSLQQL